MAAFLVSSCGGGSVSTNEQLSNLPGMTKKYGEQIKDMKQEIKNCTDVEKAMKLDNEMKELKKEAEKTIDEYLVKNPITDVPFEQKADYQFKINKVWVEGSSISRINYRAKVTITEDIVGDYGNPPSFKKNFFAYAIAVDKEGKSLTKNYGVFMNAGKKPFKANMEVEIYGSLDGPADLVNFEKLIFVAKDYKNTNK